MIITSAMLCLPRIVLLSAFVLLTLVTLGRVSANAAAPQRPTLSPKRGSSSSSDAGAVVEDDPSSASRRTIAPHHENTVLMTTRQEDASGSYCYDGVGNGDEAAWGGHYDTLSSSLTHGVDLDRQAVIEGDETQIVTITLQPGQTVRATPRSLIYRTDGVEMRTSIPGGVGRRLLTDTPIFQVDYVNTNRERVGRVVLGRRLPSKILRLRLDDHGGRLVVRKGSLLLMSDPTKMKIGVRNTRGLLEALFGGQGFFQQTIEGRGQILVTSGGTQIKVDLKKGESIRVEPSTLVAYTAGVEYSVTKHTGWTNVLFGDENLYVTTLRGPGTVWLQGLNPQFFQKRTVRVENNGRNGSRKDRFNTASESSARK
jgi:uncharacterized protein (AIM24 family)